MRGEPPVLDGFEHRGMLGIGGFSTVYLYEQVFPKRQVAVKVVHVDGLTDDGIQQFQAEANVMAALSAHPSIVTIHTSGIAPDGRPYLVMEYYPGPNLRVRSLESPLGVQDVLRMGIHIASAVETVHRAGILHCDIKPANILISPYGRAALTDFGISIRDKERTAATGFSTPWAPPETFADDSALDARSDVYSFGATLYTLLTGVSPFESGTGTPADDVLIERIRRDAVPTTGRADVPPELERLLALTMSKAREVRPASALALAHALQEIEDASGFERTAVDVLDDLVRTSHDRGPSLASVIGVTHDRTTRRPTSPASSAPPIPPTSSTAEDHLVERTIRVRDLRREATTPPVPSPTNAPPTDAPPADGTRGRSLVVAAVGVLVVLGVVAVLLTRDDTTVAATPATAISSTTPPVDTAPAADDRAYQVEVDFLSIKRPGAKAQPLTKASIVYAGLDGSVDLCVQFAAGNEAQQRAAFEGARLYTQTGDTWTRVDATPTISTDGGKCEKGQTNLIVPFAHPAPDEDAAVGEWSACTTYRLRYVAPTDTAPTNIDMCVRSRVA